MSSEDKFWLTLWLGICSLATIIILAALFNGYRLGEIEARAIAASNDPIATACALNYDVAQNSTAAKSIICYDKVREKK